jgi:hypothetical protein
MGEVRSYLLGKVLIHFVPVLLIVPDSLAAGTDGYQIAEPGKFSDVFKNEKRVVDPFPLKWACGDKQFGLNDFVTIFDRCPRSFPADRPAFRAQIDGTPDDARFACRPPATSPGNVMGVDALE